MRIINRKAILLLAAGALVLAGCGNDRKAANEANFKLGLNTHFAKMKECVNVGSEPNEAGIIQEFRTDGRGFGAKKQPTYVTLKNAGLLKTVEYLKEEPTFSGGTSESIKYVGYKFSDKGLSFLRPPELDAGFFSTGTPKLCYATAQVIDVTNFTEPSDVMGVKASNVKFTYKLVDVADWISIPEVDALYKGLADKIAATSLEDDEDMVLTNNGWMHHSEVK